MHVIKIFLIIIKVYLILHVKKFLGKKLFWEQLIKSYVILFI